MDQPLLDAQAQSAQEQFIRTWTRLKERYGSLPAWKLAALFFGARDLTARRDPLNPNCLRRAGFSAARNIVVGGTLPLKLPTQESMLGAQYSPLEFDGARLANRVTGESIQAADYPLEIPASVASLLPTASRTVSVMAFPGCALFDAGRPCEFCIAGPALGKRPLSPAQAVRELELLFSIGYRAEGLTINTGQPLGAGEDLFVVGAIAQAVRRRFPQLSIAAEIGPFSLLSQGNRLDALLKRTGLDAVDTFMVNVELVSDAARKRLCPAKPALARYREVMRGLAALGYSVTTVVQLNFYLESEEIGEVCAFLRELAAEGKGRIVPELLVSRAVPGSTLADTYWNTLGTGIQEGEAFALMAARFSLLVERLARIGTEMEGLSFAPVKAGCVRCGMCNLNSVLVRVRED